MAGFAAGFLAVDVDVAVAAATILQHLAYCSCYSSADAAGVEAEAGVAG